MARRYTGALILPCDNPGNLGAMSQLVKLVSNSIDYSKCKNRKEMKLLKANADLALKKLGCNFTPQMTFSNFKMKYLLGYGSYGCIWMSKNKSTGSYVAIKQMPATLESCSDIWKERDIMISLKHPRICNLMGAFYHVDAFLVMELCYGSVAALETKITLENAVRFTTHLLEAVKWMHSRNIVHSDLKPENCLIKTDNTLAVSDFGSAFILQQDQNYAVLDDPHGSHGYQDYQALKFLQFSKKTDVFASACIIYGMDLNMPLLLYPFRQDCTREDYIDAFENGRLIGFLPGTVKTKLQREPIVNRIFDSRFGWLLEKMIKEPYCITAKQALNDSSFRRIVNKTNVSLTSPSKRKDYVTRTITYQKSKPFSVLNHQRDITATDMSFLTFYYDEDDNVNTLFSDIMLKALRNQPSQHGITRNYDDESDEISSSDEEETDLLPIPCKRSRGRKNVDVSPTPTRVPKLARTKIPTHMHVLEENSLPLFHHSHDRDGIRDGLIPEQINVTKSYVVNHPDLTPLPSTSQSSNDDSSSSPAGRNNTEYMHEYMTVPTP